MDDLCNKFKYIKNKIKLSINCENLYQGCKFISWNLIRFKGWY